MDADLRSIQQARSLVAAAGDALHEAKSLDQAAVDRIVEAMAAAGAQAAERLARLACDETGFGRVDSKKLKNLFATRRLAEAVRGMPTVGVVARPHDGTVWEVASPMGVVAALIPSTNPTSTALYKAIIAAKARCAIVMSPHPRASGCTAEALRVVAEAAVAAGAPKGLFACMTEVSESGTEALLSHPSVDVILATGGSAMVRAAYSKGKPAYGVGSGNVPVWVDRSADVDKAARDLVYGASFDWGVLCSTERSVVADLPIRARLLKALETNGAHFVTPGERDLLRAVVVREGRLNPAQVGKPPHDIAALAGFSVPRDTRVLVSEADAVGPAEPLSRETLSPILTFYTADGWQAGCERCMEILAYGGMGHTLGIHGTNERVIEAFALQKPAMRIVVNSVTALGSVGYTNRLFPALTLGPGTLGGSITSDNISPLHLLNIKRVAFETDPVHRADRALPAPTPAAPSGRRRASAPASGTDWMARIDERLRARAGSPPTVAAPASLPDGATQQAIPAPETLLPVAQRTSPSGTPAAASPDPPPRAALSDAEIEKIVAEFSR